MTTKDSITNAYQSAEEARARLVGLLEQLTPEERDRVWSEYRARCLSVEEIDRAAVVLAEIAMLTSQAQCVLREAIEHTTWETSQAALLAGAADSLLGQIGFCADLGNEILGGKLAVKTGGAEEWLMPPIYRRAAEETPGPANG